MNLPNVTNKKACYQLNSKLFIFHKALSGVADGARTHDNRNHNPGLYQLSYSHQAFNYSGKAGATYCVTASSVFTLPGAGLVARISALKRSFSPL